MYRGRKIVFVIIVLCLFSANINAQKYRFGIYGSPALSYIRSEQQNIDTKSILKFNFGLVGEFRLAGKYYLASGVDILQKGGELTIRDTVGNYSASYIHIPLVLKMKSREFGYTTFFGKFGGGFSFKTSENIKFEPNPNTGLSSYLNAINIMFTIGGGVEYNLGGSTSLVGELTFNSALLNDFDKANIYVGNNISRFNYVALAVGVLF